MSAYTDDLGEYLRAAAEKLDAQATEDAIAALALWTHHLPFCGLTPCDCGLDAVLAAMRSQP